MMSGPRRVIQDLSGERFQRLASKQCAGGFEMAGSVGYFDCHLAVVLSFGGSRPFGSRALDREGGETQSRCCVGEGEFEFAFHVVPWVQGRNFEFSAGEGA